MRASAVRRRCGDLAAIAPPMISPAPIANIGVAERRKRLVFGITILAVSAVLAAALIYIRAPLRWRLPLFLLFFVAALGLFQSRDKT
jgi:hypothetical protein